MIATVATSAACGSGVAGDGDPPESALTLAEARLEAERLVDEAVAEAAPDDPMREDGLGDLPCDPPSSGLVDYDYVLAVDVDDGSLDAVVNTAFEYLESEGFEAVGDPPSDPSLK